MTNITVSSKQARDNFSDILGRVRYADQVITIEKKGRPYGVIISPAEYERYKRIAKEQFFKSSAQIQKRNSKFSEKEVMEDIASAVEEVREDRYDSRR
ncbi:type II toxin-antitoxin system Phd/YefM family antitoxin [Candidatus Curtissbacteria bacterium]|nr:type II toxin-antitoxin system Phd/YefM family antitoxin [Candidatus Curtissbacteria bacterium]